MRRTPLVVSRHYGPEFRRRIMGPINNLHGAKAELVEGIRFDREKMVQQFSKTQNCYTFLRLGPLKRSALNQERDIYISIFCLHINVKDSNNPMLTTGRIIGTGTG